MAKTVRQVVDESIALLSTLQLDTGDFSSWGTQNAESTCQVTVALCALGIDPLTDSRFIKNGNTLLDGILRYRKDSGGFVHSFVYDPENPTADPDEPNTMAGEQVLYTMAALWRQASGLRPLYDFRPERSKALKERIASLNGSLDAVDGSTSQATLEGLLKEFYSLPETERYAVQGYWRLSDTAKSAGVDVSAIEAATQVVESPPDESDDVFGGTFTDSDRRRSTLCPKS